MHLYKKKLIAFSLGNFYTNGNFNLFGNLKHGVILSANLSSKTGNFISGQLTSTVQRSGKLYKDNHNNAAKLITVLSEIDFKEKIFSFDQNFNFTPLSY